MINTIFLVSSHTARSTRNDRWPCLCHCWCICHYLCEDIYKKYIRNLHDVHLRWTLFGRDWSYNVAVPVHMVWAHS